jgi:hypothetical protein
MSFDEAAADALDAERQHAVPASWVDSAAACETFRPEYSFYAKQESGVTSTKATATSLWKVVCTIGNDGDYFYGRVLWWLRRVMDWVVGGPSLRRRRRHPTELRMGDVVDSWRVIALEPEKRLTLLMEMKAPGAGVLELAIDDDGETRTISMTAYWHPAGVWGLLYWYATLPFHSILFRGTVRAIAARAESGQS